MAALLRRGRLQHTSLLACALVLLPASAQSPVMQPGSNDAAPTASAPASSAAAATRRIDSRSRKQALRLYQRGATQLRGLHYADAEQDFAEAVRLDPSRPEYYQAMVLSQETRVTGLLHTAAQERAQHPLLAERLMAEARGIDPANPQVLQHDRASAAPLRPAEILSGPRFVPAGAIRLQPNTSLESFHQSTDTRALAQAIGTAYGLRVAIDPDLQSKQLRIELDRADYTSAVGVFNMLAGTFVTPLDEHTMLVAEDTTANRARLEHLFEEVIPLPGYSTEQINETANMIRTVFELKQVSVAVQARAIAVRAPEDTMNAIDATLADLLDSGSEVVIDFKLYSIDTQNTRNLGIVLPTSFTLFSVASEVQRVLSSNASLIQQLLASGVLPSTATSAEIAAYLVFAAGLGTGTNLQNTFFIFGGGLNSITSGNNNLSVTPVGLATSSYPSLNFALTNSDARQMDNLQLRIADRATGIFKAGMRYPIQTAIYSDVASSTTSSNTLQALLAKYLGTSASTLNTSSTIPQFQYEDLGMVVNATPRVLGSNEVSMKLDIKISALSGAAINGIPVLANRQFSSTLALRDGETAVLSSHVQDSEAAAITGVPGLTDLPGLSNLTNRNTTKARTNLVLLVTPHIVRRTHDEAKGPLIPLQPRPADD